jgi:hypothetical protein
MATRAVGELNVDRQRISGLSQVDEHERWASPISTFIVLGIGTA